MVKVGELTWDGDGHSRIRNGRRGDAVVAQLVKNFNHTHSNDGIWSVHVMGQALDERFRHARDAQSAAWEAYQRHRQR